jgi:uncharacterized lipoprotein YddW (UPF0748 family)
VFEIGLWAEAIGEEAPLLSERSVRTLVENAQQMGVTDIYLQLYRQGCCWWGAKDPLERAPEIAHSLEDDKLELLLELAQQSEIRVHAWLNVFQLSANFSSQAVSSCGADCLIEDNFGWQPHEENSGNPPHHASALHIDTPGCWIDPANHRYREYFQRVIADLIEQYPGISGIHLDYVRYPYYVPVRPSSAVSHGADFGYGDATRKDFARIANREDPFTVGDNRELLPAGYSTSCQWDDWRRAQVTAVVDAIKSRWGKDYKISTAVICWSDRAYLSAFQNWRAWLSQEVVDQVALMSYTGNNELFSQLVQQAAVFQSKKSRLLAGIAAYLLKDPEAIQAQVSAARQAGAAGIILFSYRNLLRDGMDLRGFDF